MSRTRVVIEHAGRRYIVGTSAFCTSKRNCSLFKHGVCDDENDRRRMLCDALNAAFERVVGTCPTRCFKEVK